MVGAWEAELLDGQLAHIDNVTVVRSDATTDIRLTPFIEIVLEASASNFLL